ncbi:hypothetical protein [Peribacillus asahii]|uniref:hypothetical protein n=1 Tax=Peribacillus asahii TaxID=228899 RepID=UPI00381867EE
MMNKEKLMDLVSEAIDQGAYISINFTQFQKEGELVVRADVEGKAQEVSRILSGPAKEVQGESADFFCINNKEISVTLAFLNKKQLREQRLWEDQFLVETEKDSWVEQESKGQKII